MLNQNIISNSGLHDYEFISISVDYVKANIYILLNDLKCNRINLSIEGFTDLRITHREPWGKGTYIVSSDMEKIDKTHIIFELNSGDTIHIEFSGSLSFNSNTFM